MPGAWKEVGAATHAVRDDFLSMTSALLAQQELLHRSAYETEHLATASHGLGRVWTGITGSARSLVGSLETALIQLSRFTALGAGLLGIGGLFGLDAYAASAGNARRTAGGLATNVPGMMAFEAEYGRFVNPGQFLGATAGALGDFTQQSWLYGLGFTPGQIHGAANSNDASGLSVEALQRMWKLLHGVSREFVGPIGRTYHLPGNQEDWMQLQQTPYAEIGEAQRHYEADKIKFNITDKDLKSWQDLQVSLDVAGKTMWTVFGKELAGWAKPIGELSDAFVKLVQDLVGSQGFGDFIKATTAGLKELTAWIDSPSFENDVKGFVKGVSDLTEEIISAVNSLKPIVEWLTGTPEDPRSLIQRIPGQSQYQEPPGGVLDPHVPEPFSWTKPWTWHDRIFGNDLGAGDIKAPQASNVMAYARAIGAGDSAVQATLAAALGEGGLSESWAVGDKTNPHGPSYGLFQLNTSGELGRYIHEGGKLGNVHDQVAYFLKRELEIDPQFLTTTDKARQARDIYTFMHGVQRPEDYLRRFGQAEQIMRQSDTAVAAASPNVQQPAPVKITLHGNTSAITSTSANMAAGGVW